MKHSGRVALLRAVLLSVLFAGNGTAATGSLENGNRMRDACEPALSAYPGDPVGSEVRHRRLLIRDVARQSPTQVFLEKKHDKLLAEEDEYLRCSSKEKTKFSAGEYERLLRCSELGAFVAFGASIELEEQSIRGQEFFVAECRVLRDFGKLERGEPLAFARAFLKEVTFDDRGPLFANFHDAYFERVFFFGVDLTGSRFYVRCVNSCIFSDSIVEGVVFAGSNLSDASILGGSLKNADFSGAAVGGMIFQPEPHLLPDSRGMSAAFGLSEMRWVYYSVPMRRLRDALKRDGYREAWVEVNYAYRDNFPGPTMRNAGSTLEYAFNKLLFGITTGYGLYPGRPLMILAVLIPVFALLYLLGLGSASRTSGVWAVWPADRVNHSDGSSQPERLSLSTPFPLSQEEQAVGRGAVSHSAWIARSMLLMLAVVCVVLAVGAFVDSIKVPMQSGETLPLGFSLLSVAVLLSLASIPSRKWRLAWRSAFYFSALSAFHFGWRDLNVGSWLQRVQPREYALRATGWVRVVSGVQSLLSVFLIALWVITYFGGALE